MIKTALFVCLILASSCTHFLEKRQRESNRHYVFNIDKLGGNWPEGYQIEGRYGSDGPEVQYIVVPQQVDGERLIQEHGVWLLEGDGRWVKNNNEEKKQ